jgi:hypothetical protein
LSGGTHQIVGYLFIGRFTFFPGSVADGTYVDSIVRHAREIGATNGTTKSDESHGSRIDNATGSQALVKMIFCRGMRDDSGNPFS